MKMIPKTRLLLRSVGVKVLDCVMYVRCLVIHVLNQIIHVLYQSIIY